MLIPNKHNHPDLTVLAVATKIIQRLRRTKVKSFDELRNIVKDYHERAEPLFLPALQLLFLLDIIEYHKKNDSVEYIG
ncbi:MAG: ABC-three component system middle component 8 [Bacteroidota bacterium]